MYIIFYGCLLFHGRVFFWWSSLPLLIYTVERLYQEICCRRRRLAIHAFDWDPPVLGVKFAPKNRLSFRFQAGAYVLINSPGVSGQWHPFTISSAPGDLDAHGTMTVHIRIQPGGWTEKFRKLAMLMAPRGKINPNESIVLYQRKANQRQTHSTGNAEAGKEFWIDGKTPLLRVKGPFPAPTQAYAAYGSAMIAGAGVGVTPCIAILNEIVRYRWRKNFGPRTN